MAVPEKSKQDVRAAIRRGSAPRGEIGFGHQIRSYVLTPYGLVKDLRTGVESSDPEGVLDGNLDAFIEAELLRRAVEPKGKASAAYSMAAVTDAPK